MTFLTLFLPEGVFGRKQVSFNRQKPSPQRVLSWEVLLGHPKGTSPFLELDTSLPLSVLTSAQGAKLFIPVAWCIW